jgi:putative ABC transport system permease protein
MINISYFRLAFALLPALIVVLVIWRWSQEATDANPDSARQSAGPRTAIYALARMILQLSLIGYALTYIFETNHSFVVMAVLAGMLVMSSWIALRTVAEKRLQLFGKALLANCIVNGGLLALVTQVVIGVQPWFSPRTCIMLAGMIFAGGMNSIALFAERYFSEIEHRPEPEARMVAFSGTLIPSINSLFAVGLVSLPGFMTGQILDGASPLIAARYQIMIMLTLFSSVGLTAAVFHQLIKQDDA